MKYELITKLNKEECIKKLKESLGDGETKNLLRDTVLYDTDVVVGNLKGDHFSFRVERPFSSSYIFARANPYVFPRTFRGFLESNETGTKITGTNRLNRGFLFTLVALSVVLLLWLITIIQSPYMLVLLIIGSTIYYSSILYKRQLAKKNGIVFKHSNIVFIEKILQANIL